MTRLQSFFTINTNINYASIYVIILKKGEIYENQL